MSEWMPVDRLLDVLEAEKAPVTAPLYRAPTPTSDEQMRARIVALAADHVAYAEIAMMYDVNPRFVARIVNEALGDPGR